MNFTRLTRDDKNDWGLFQLEKSIRDNLWDELMYCRQKKIVETMNEDDTTNIPRRRAGNIYGKGGMKHVDLQNFYEDSFSLILRPGMGWAVYTDFGPTGPCGQGMSTTCPHMRLHIFDNREDLASFLSSEGTRKGQKYNLFHGVIGDYSTGNAAIVDHTVERE